MTFGALARPSHRAAAGTAAMLVSSTLGGSALILARLAYSGGTTTTTVLLFRFALVVVVLAAYVAWRGRGWRLNGRALWLSLALGAAHGVSSWAYLGAVRYIPASLAVLIVYTYPPMVGVAAHFVGGERLTWRKIGALVVSYVGLAIALELSLESLHPTGAILALVSAVMFAATVLVGSRAMAVASPARAQLHSAAFNVVFLSVFGWAAGELRLPDSPIGWVGFFGLGFALLITFLTFAAAVHLIGPSRTSIINNLEPIVAVVLSVLILRETFGAWQAIGGALVLAGVAMAHTRGGANPLTTEPIHISPTERLNDRPFTDPENNAVDTAILRRMVERLREALQRGVPASPRPYILHLHEPDGRMHRIVIANLQSLLAHPSPVVVGFFGRKQPDADPQPIDQADRELIDEFPHHPGVLSYSSMQLEDGNWANLVLLSDSSAKDGWRQNTKHCRVTEELAPHYYAVLRLHNGVLRGSVLGGDGVGLTSTKYYDFRGEKPWKAVRAADGQ